MTPDPRIWPVRVLEGLRKYRFEIRHLTILVLVLVAFQFIVVFLNQRSLQGLFGRSQQWYQQDAAERIANLTATSFELLLESTSGRERLTHARARQIVQEFNIIFSQQLLDKNVLGVCILLPAGNGLAAIDDGQELYDHLFGDARADSVGARRHEEAVRWYRDVEARLRQTEQTMTVVEGGGVFHVFVPFVPQGEFAGAVYMKSKPDLSFLTTALSAGYDETALLYAMLIIGGMLAMFYISTRSLAERNEAQHALFEEQKRHLSDQIAHQKEMVFTRRIYHAHHKAEKIGGFIKEDLRQLTPETIEPVKHRIGKYASFVSRVIYDMKWYDPPLQTIRGPMFRTDVNDVIRFIVDHVFRRVAGEGSRFSFDLRLDPSMPAVAVNEFVLWEVLEPLIQNSLDHAGRDRIVVTIRTEPEHSGDRWRIVIEDNGAGIRAELLEVDGSGRKKVFLEHVSGGSSVERRHTGYGCYIAHEIATQRLGWTMDAENLPTQGCRFTITIPV